jgi:hypothetical protein
VKDGDEARIMADESGALDGFVEPRNWESRAGNVDLRTRRSILP